METLIKWLLISIVIGIVCGLLFLIVPQVVMYIIGIVIYCIGVFVLSLSALLPVIILIWGVLISTWPIWILLLSCMLIWQLYDKHWK